MGRIYEGWPDLTRAGRATPIPDISTPRRELEKASPSQLNAQYWDRHGTSAHLIGQSWSHSSMRPVQPEMQANHSLGRKPTQPAPFPD